MSARFLHYKLNNILTISRILLTPVFLACFYIPNEMVQNFGIYMFAILCLTDLLDGYIARKFKTESRIGAMLDPLADKILSLSALILLVDMSQITRILMPMVYIIFFREITVMGIRTIMPKIKSSQLSKLKTFILNIAIMCFLVNMSFDEPNEILHIVASCALLLSTIFSTLALIGYLRESFKK